MFYTGFDSTKLAKKFVPLEDFLNRSQESNQTNAEESNPESPEPEELKEEPVDSEEANALPKLPIVLKALIGASVTTQDPDFDEHYKTTLGNVFERHDIRLEKTIYKGAHMVKQIGANFDEVFTEILNEIGPALAHIDLYFATYPKPFISIFGKAQGERLGPLEYIEKHQNGFAHACAWWHWRTYSKGEREYEYHIDHFEGRATPAWAEMESNKVNIKSYYNGSECDCLISFADLILKALDIFHFGTIDYRSTSQPIRKRARTFALTQKIKSYDLAKYDWTIRATVPELPLDINLNRYVKHPIYFIAWTPTLPRKTVKVSFEWSKLYNSIIQKAIKTKGCVKFLDFDRDMTFWDTTDFIIPWEAPDEEHVRLLLSMGFERMPKILKSSDIIT